MFLFASDDDISTGLLLETREGVIFVEYIVAKGA